MARRAIRGAAALAAAGVVALGPAAGTALATDPPAATASVVVDTHDRSLGLQGVQNARDAGGYRTADGRTVRTGLVYRSGELSKATDADLAALTDRGVAVVADLRTGYERALAPDRTPAGATPRIADVIGQAPPQVMASTLVAGTDLYRALVTEPGANAGFASILHDIIDTDGAVLYHCSAGKDRTGWMSAVLLTALGVDRDTVTYDFLLSNHYRGAGPDDPLNGVVQPALDAAFDQVDRTYGGFDGYLRDGLRLTGDDIAALRAKLLA